MMWQEEPAVSRGRRPKSPSKLKARFSTSSAEGVRALGAEVLRGCLPVGVPPRFGHNRRHCERWILIPQHRFSLSPPPDPTFPPADVTMLMSDLVFVLDVQILSAGGIV